MTDGLLPKRQRPLCQDCQAGIFGPLEKYTFQDWPAGTCRRSRKYHRRQALLWQPGTTTYRDGKAVREVPLPDEEAWPADPA